MGEIAEDILNGFSCAHCGVRFRDEAGYPGLCEECYEEQMKLFNNLFTSDKNRFEDRLIPPHPYGVLE